jgi:nucleotide-binding universal stress UspA family protein
VFHAFRIPRTGSAYTSEMEGIVVAAKAGADQPWVADGAAELAHQTGAAVSVVSVDGVEMEALSPLPRSEYQEEARKAAEAIAARIRERGVEASADVRAGKVVAGILLFAEEHDADVIVVGASTKGAVARRVLGDVPLELVQRSRRPVLVVSDPGTQG